MTTHTSRHSASTSRSGMIITASSVQEKISSHHIENTFRVAPVTLFPIMETKRIVEQVLREELHDKEYDSHKTNGWAMELANKIKHRMKSLKYGRYRIVTFVAIGQKENSTINVASRCIWNESCDQFVEASYTNISLYAVALVYAIYFE